MRTVVLGPPPPALAAFIKDRRDRGQDGHDEIWEGEYHMAPMAHRLRGFIDKTLGRLVGPFADAAGLVATSGFNLGEPDDFRAPDGGYHRGLPTTVYVPTAAIVVEVVSPDDETYVKFDFYARHDVDDLIVADPAERRVRFFRRQGIGYVEGPRSDLLAINADQLTAGIEWPS